MNYPFSLAAPVGSIRSQLRALGVTLKSVRTEKGLSARRQALRAGLSPEAVERIERGACSVSFGEVLALCHSLGIRLTPESSRPASHPAPHAVGASALLGARSGSPRALSDSVTQPI